MEHICLQEKDLKGLSKLNAQLKKINLGQKMVSQGFGNVSNLMLRFNSPQHFHNRVEST